MSYGGGGFSNSQGGSQDSPGGGDKKPAGSVRPMNIHQILNAEQGHTDAPFTVDGHEITTICLVACVRNVTVSSTNLSFVVEDGTGQIDVRLWIDQAESLEEAELRDTLMNKYILVMGQLKVFSSKKHFNATHYRALDDLNEVLYHSLNVVHATLLLRNDGVVPAANGAPRKAVANTAASYLAGNAPAAGGDDFSTFRGVQKDIMQFIGTLDSMPDEGVNITYISNQIHKSESAVRSAVEELIGEGHLYTTVDEDHVLSI